MMPYIEEQQTSADMVSEFRGYNHNPVIGDNEFFDMENMTGDRYPLASVRDKRGVMDLDIDGVLLGLEGKDKPLVLWSDNANAIPSFAMNNLYAITVTGEAGEDAQSGASYPTNPSNGQYFRLTDGGSSTLKKYIYKYWSYTGGERKEWITARFDKLITRASASSRGNNTFVLVAPMLATESSTWINGIGFLYNTNFFSDVDGHPDLLGATLTCNSGCYSDIPIGETEGLNEISEFLTGKTAYLGTDSMMYSTPLHIVGVSDYAVSGSRRYCVVYFSKAELESQGIADIYGQYFWDDINQSPTLMIKTTDIEIDDEKNYGGNGYIAFYNPETKELENTTEIGSISAGEKQLVSMGANVIIFPDKLIINTLKIEDSQFTDIQSLEHTLTDSNVSIYSTASNASSGSTLPTDPEDGEYFWDTSGEIAVLKQYSEAQGRWATRTAYLYISGITEPGLKKGDAIKIENSALITHIPSGQKNFVIDDVWDSHIKLQCNFTSPVNLTSQSITLSRILPEMDFIIESNNRIWGCHYGLNANGEMVNEIFASKLGDPFNWFYFANTSIDSYYVSLGSEGAFTGAVNYQSTPTFFKADIIHRIVGDYPAQYQLKTIEGYGVRPGCNKSISVMNDIVYYLSPVGMVAFNGGIPVSLAVPFGEVRYDKCISGDIGNKLYCSMHDEYDKWSMFVYDDSNGLWHREDGLHAEDFGTYNGELLCVSSSNLYSLGGVYGDTENDFEWMLQTGDMGFMSPQRKTIRRLVLRIKLAITSRARIEIQYDNDGIWRPVNELRPSGRIRSYAVPIKPFRCDHYSIRIKGKGEFDLQSITRHWAEGSELD